MYANMQRKQVFKKIKWDDIKRHEKQYKKMHTSLPRPEPVFEMDEIPASYHTKFQDQVRQENKEKKMADQIEFEKKLMKRHR